MSRRPTILEAPSVLGLRPTGVEELPAAILAAGLAERLRARRGGRVEPPAYEFGRDADTGMLNLRGLAAYTPALADAVSEVLSAGAFPLVLGGDCSILLGTMLALRRRGRYGLLFLDGHADFYQPEANVNGEAASSDLALATGRGPDVLTTFETFRPLVRDEDVVVLGQRDAEEAARFGSQPLPAGITVIDLAGLRALGAEAAARTAVEHLSRSPLEGFWIHLDADVLDDAVMPAADYRMPGGLTFDELRAVLRVALGCERAAGLELTIFNPRLDAGGVIARSLVSTLAEGFAASASGSSSQQRR